MRENNFPWDVDICAARGGNIDTIKYLRENGCLWDEYSCAFAAEKGILRP